MDNKIKNEIKAYNDLAEDFASTKIELRSQVLSTMKVILENGGDKMSEDYDFLEEYGCCDGTPTVTYDGGNHPEYATNAFSQVSGAFLEDGKIYIICEDCDEYSVDRIWNLDELIAILDMLIAYMEDKEEEDNE